MPGRKGVEKEPVPMFSGPMSRGVEVWSPTPCRTPQSDKIFLMRSVGRCYDLRAAEKDSCAQVCPRNQRDYGLGEA